jgi:multidrug resistance efflux pump
MKIRFDENRQQKSEVQRGIQIPYASGKRQAPVWRWYLVLLVVLSPLVYFLFTALHDVLTISAPGVVAGESISVSSPRSARIEAVVIREGDRVRAGQELFRLYDSGVQRKMTMLRAQQEVLDDLAEQRDHQSPGLSGLRTRVELLKERLEYARQYFKDIQYLFDQGAAPRADLRKARSDRRQAALALAQARSELQEAIIDVQGKRQAIDVSKDSRMIQAELDYLIRQGVQRSITAPESGVLRQLMVQEGQNVASGHRLARISNMDTPRILAYLDPKHMDRLEGQEYAVVLLPTEEELRARIDPEPLSYTQLPEELIPTLEPSKGGLVLELHPLQELPDHVRVQGLPVEVLFSGLLDGL